MGLYLKAPEKAKAEKSFFRSWNTMAGFELWHFLDGKELDWVVSNNVLKCNGSVVVQPSFFFFGCVGFKSLGKKATEINLSLFFGHRWQKPFCRSHLHKISAIGSPVAWRANVILWDFLADLQLPLWHSQRLTLLYRKVGRSHLSVHTGNGKETSWEAKGLHIFPHRGYIISWPQNSRERETCFL